MTPRSQFLGVTIPAFEAFVSYYAEREMGLHADAANAARLAEALRDLPEHAFNDPSSPSGFNHGRSYRESFWPHSWSYQLTCNFADAWKHRDLTRSNRLINGIGDVVDRLLVIRCTDDRGFYYVLRKLLAVTANDGHEYDLAEHLVRSMQLWSDELVRRGIIPNAPALRGLPLYYQTRSEAESAEPMRIFAHVKEHFELWQRCLILEPESTQPRPVERGDTFAAKYNVVFHVLPSPLESSGVAG
jgi:hypothetical protein